MPARPEPSNAIPSSPRSSSARTLYPCMLAIHVFAVSVLDRDISGCHNIKGNNRSISEILAEVSSCFPFSLYVPPREAIARLGLHHVPCTSGGQRMNITAPDGSFLTCKRCISYLGSYLDASGTAGPEICRRLGEAKGQFDKLAKVWRHSTLRTQQKIRIFQACVVSKLLYCLHTMWLNKAELRKIDGFQARCLRSILRIPPPYISRISNATVLQRGRCKCLSAILKFRQLLLFQSIAVLPDDVRRRCIFQPSRFILQSLSAPRRRGRPKQMWASEV